MRVILVAAAILLAVPVQAAPVRLSEMTREQEVIMQSASYPTLMCMLNLIQEIKGYPLLKGVRGKKGANIALIEKELLKTSKMLTKEKKIKELDINPLMATPTQLVAVDARIITY